MTTVYTIIVKYVHKNTIHKVSYSFPTHREFNKALDIIRNGASYNNGESNIVDYDWEFSNSMKSSEDMLSRMKRTTNIIIGK